LASKWDVGLYEINDRLGVLDRQDIEDVEQVVGDDGSAAELEKPVEAKFPICANVKPLDEFPHIVSTRSCGRKRTAPSRPTSRR
jgi:hypothetical protein